MLDLLKNPTFWLCLFLIYLGIATFFIGNARNNNATISGFGIIVSIGAIIFAIVQFNWWIGILLGFIAYLTSLPYISIPVLLGYIYWKIKYNPKYLTLFRFHGLIFEQYQPVKFKPLLVDVFVDKAIEEKLGKNTELFSYVEEILNSESKFVAEELFSDYKIFKEYVLKRKENGYDNAIRIFKRYLGIVPMTRFEAEIALEDTMDEIRRMTEKRK